MFNLLLGPRQGHFGHFNAGLSCLKFKLGCFVFNQSLITAQDGRLAAAGTASPRLCLSPMVRHSLRNLRLDADGRVTVRRRHRGRLRL